MSILVKVTHEDKIILSDIDLNELKRINDYASAKDNEISFEHAVDIMKGKKLGIGCEDTKEYMYTNGLYKFIIFISNAPSSDFKKACKVRRLYVSMNLPDKYPSDDLIKLVMKQLNFSEFEKCLIAVNKDQPEPNIEIRDVFDKRTLSDEESERLKSLYKGIGA